MSDEFAAVVDAVRERVTPDADERERLRTVTDRLVERTEDAIADLPVDAEVSLVGSTARDTWLAGDRDVDLFVLFPPDLDRDDLERFGLDVGHAVLPDGREEYAEHPYVVGECDGFTVDLVPCYDLADASDVRTAVDRTPFHTAYLAERLDEEDAAAVRVCKAFLKGIDAYGSDLATRGFSGYLTELLVLEYGGFRPFVDAAADWTPPVVIDPAAHGSTTFDDPLVVIDPTDPDRNVAAVCSAANVARVQHYARRLLATPDSELFEPSAPEPLSDADLRAAIEARGTTPVALRFDAPEVVDDTLWPQLRSSLASAVDELDRRGFDVFRAEAFADETAVLFLELAVTERPTVERHTGPPVAVRDHADGFYEKYAGSDCYGPFIDGDRYVVERDRAFTTATEFLDSSALFDLSLGRHVAEALEDKYTLHTGRDVTALLPEFGTALARYYSPKP